MENLAPPWLDDLGLKKEHLAFCPPGEKPLLWALRTDFLQEDLYLRWASEKYQLPLLSPEFFSFSFDGTLVEKFSSIYPWSSSCYPIYEWENTLYVAALEPLEIDSSFRICTMIAPLTELERGWQKIQERNPKQSPAESVFSQEEEEEEVVVGLPDLANLQAPDQLLDLKELENHSEDQADVSPVLIDISTFLQNDHTEIISNQLPEVDFKNKATQDSIKTPDFKESLPDPVEEFNSPPPMPELDFSTLVSDEPQNPPTLEKVPTDIRENTQTVSGAFQNRTTATSTLHLHAHQKIQKDEEVEAPLTELAFENLSIDQFSLEGDPEDKKPSKIQIPEKNKKIQAQPATVKTKKAEAITSLDDLVELKANGDLSPPPPPSLSMAKDDEPELSTLEEEESQSVSESLVSEASDDDYTPLPFIVKSDQQNTKNTSAPTFSEPETRENTQTDHGLPSFVPAGQLISSEDLMSSKEINQCKDMKSVISFIFNHLKNDYKKLMWIEAHSDGQFYPGYVYGPWHMTTEAWKKPINTDSPNIFRIAHLSNLPYHGEIHDNPFNDAYFKLWTRNQKPDFATVAPAYYDDISYGFIVGFSKGIEFEPTGSLKKIENLLSICKNQMIQAPNKIAS